MQSQDIDHKRQEESVSNKNESLMQRLAMEEQGSQSTDNFVQMESDQGDASFSGEIYTIAIKKKSMSHQSTVSNVLIESLD